MMAESSLDSFRSLSRQSHPRIGTNCPAIKVQISTMPVLSTLLLLGARQSAFDPGPNPLLMQQPTINRTSIVFSFAGDLWMVSRSGGDATRLTSSPGTEDNPYFSPDGSTIAFSAQYHGNNDVFTVPAEGGVPKRLTYHPSPKSVGRLFFKRI